MDQNTLSLIAGAVISLFFSYIPGLNTWFAGKSPDTQRGLMAILLLLTAAASFGLSCAGVLTEFGVEIECSRSGLFDLARVFILALVANQSTYSISAQFKSVKLVRSARKA